MTMPAPPPAPVERRPGGRHDRRRPLVDLAAIAVGLVAYLLLATRGDLGWVIP
jgi:hypothetical protein